MYLSLAKNNPQVEYIKQELLRDGNQKAKKIVDDMPDDVKGDTSYKTLIQYVSFVRTNLLEKKVIYVEKVS